MRSAEPAESPAATPAVEVVTEDGVTLVTAEDGTQVITD
jgi:hypothetical protein